MAAMEHCAEEACISTGIAGLDDVLRGGLTRNRMYLVEGNPGSGKTTLALQFLLEGVRRNEATLYVTLSETRKELLAVGRSHGWNLDAINIFEMAPPEKSLATDEQLTMFHASELELSDTMQSVLKQVETLKPKRIVFDSLSEVRLLAQHPLRYRRQILALKQFLAGRDSTVLLLDDRTSAGEDLHLQSIAHGVIFLEMLNTEYGSERRQVRIIKMRGVSYRGGVHDFVIRKGGLEIFPRLVAGEHQSEFADNDLASGISALDKLLGGGLTRGSATLLLGPAGSGKSSVATQFCVAAAARGERAAMYIFDETVESLKKRSRKLGMPLDEYVKKGLISVQQVDPAELSPGEFAARVRQTVEGEGKNGRPATVILIDSLNGYLNSMAGEKQLMAQLHELFTYLNQRGVVTLVTLAQSGVMGPSMQTPIDTTYLADNVLLFRYFEDFGQVRRAMSVVKKRSSHHELTIRELRTGGRGLEVGEPLAEFQGILTGVPQLYGRAGKIRSKNERSEGEDAE